MKPGLQIGNKAELEISVSEAMLATFGQRTVHRLFSTASLVHHMEWVSRQVLEPFLEDHEEGMGYHAEVSHLKPTLPGMKVMLKATVIAIRESKITCEVEAFHARGKIARGSVTQAVVEKAWLENKMKEMALVHQLSQDTESSARNLAASADQSHDSQARS